MLRIKNLTNSPYEILLADGSRVLVPARGNLDGVDVHPNHLSLYRSLGYFVIEDVDASSDDDSKNVDADAPSEKPVKRGRPRKEK